MELDLVDEHDIARIVHHTKTIAIIGLSANEARPSWGVARFLQSRRYRVIPVNPGHAGQRILGQVVHARLSDIPASERVDMVDIFRRSDAVAGIVEEALNCLPDLSVIWTQLGVRDDSAAATARSAGVTVIQDRCPKIEFARHL